MARSPWLTATACRSFRHFPLSIMPRALQSTQRSGLWKRAIAFVFVLVVLALLTGFVATRILVGSAESRFPQTGEIVPVDGLRQHYVVRGKGSPVVLLHGGYGALQNWEATIMDDLATSFTVYAFDRPGHGYSQRGPNDELDPAAQAEFLHTALAELGVKKPLLVGQSCAAALVLAYALQWGDELGGAVVISGVTHPWTGGIGLTAKVSGVPGLGHLLRHTVAMPIGSWFATSFVRESFAPSPVPDRYAQDSAFPLSLRPSNFAYNGIDLRLLYSAVLDQSKRYPFVSIPVAIVYGEEDQLVDPKYHALLLHDALPSSTLHPVAAAGHQVIWTHPSEVVRAIRALHERVSVGNAGY